MAARVITEADVRDGKAGDPIVVDERTAITPSALDAATRLGVRVVWRRTGEAERSAPGAGAGVARVPVLQLPDGQYLVHVQGGRARVFRVTPKGPVPFE